MEIWASNASVIKQVNMFPADWQCLYMSVCSCFEQKLHQNTFCSKSCPRRSRCGSSGRMPQPRWGLLWLQVLLCWHHNPSQLPEQPIFLQTSDSLCHDLTGINAISICSCRQDHLEHTGVKTQPFHFIQLPPLYQKSAYLHQGLFGKRAAQKCMSLPPLLKPSPSSRARKERQLDLAFFAFFFLQDLFIWIMIQP